MDKSIRIRLFRKSMDSSFFLLLHIQNIDIIVNIMLGTTETMNQSIDSIIQKHYNKKEIQ